MQAAILAASLGIAASLRPYAIAVAKEDHSIMTDWKWDGSARPTAAFAGGPGLIIAK